VQSLTWEAGFVKGKFLEAD